MTLQIDIFTNRYVKLIIPLLPRRVIINWVFLLVGVVKMGTSKFLTTIIALYLRDKRKSSFRMHFKQRVELCRYDYAKYVLLP